MSNYLSKPIETAPIVSNYNFELINQVLATKQGQYNYNREKLQNAIAYVENLKVSRPQDQEYLNAKISEMYSTLNMGDKNLSDGVVADTYYSAIMSVAQDPTIVNAVGSTQVINNFYANIQKMQSDPKTMGQVNDRNIAHSLENSGVNAYMRGEVDSVKSINYIPFTDTKAKANDTVERLTKLNPKQTIEVDGRITTIEGLSPQEIRRIVENSLDESDLRQIEIDAWYNSGGFKDERYLTEAQRQILSEAKKLEFDRAEIERNIEKGGTQKQMTEWNTKLEAISQKQQEVKIGSADIRNTAVHLQKESLINGVVNVYGNLYTESSVINWQQKNYELNLKKFQYQIEKDERANQTAQAQGLQPITYGTDTEANKPDSIIKQFDEGTTELKTKLDGYSKTYKDRLTQLSRTDKQAKQVIDEYNERLKNRQQGQSDLDIFRELITERGNSLPSNLTTFKEGDKDVNYLDEIKINTEQYDSRLSAYNTFKAEDDREYIANTIDSENTLRAFNSNKNTKMLWNGQAVPVHQILKQRGIIDNNGNKIGSLLDESNADLLQELKKSYFADYALSMADAGGVDEKSITELSRLFNENPNDVIQYSTYTTRTGDGYVDRQSRRVNPNTKTGQFIEQARKNGIRELWQLEDQSLSVDDVTINNYIQGYFSRKPSQTATENLRRFTSMLPENKAINVTTENPFYESFRNYVSGSAFNQGLSLTPNSKEPILIRNINNDELEVRVMTGSGKNASMQPIRLLKRDVLGAFPQIAEKVDFESSQGDYDLRAYAGQSIKSDNIRFTPADDITRKEYLTETVLRPYGNKYIDYADADSTKDLFKTSFTNLKASIPGYNTLIDRVIDSAGDYTVSLDVSNGATKVAIKLVENSTGNLIYALPMNVDSNFKINDVMNLIKRAPEVIYGDLISQILITQNAMVVQGVETDPYKKLVNSLSN